MSEQTQINEATSVSTLSNSPSAALAAQDAQQSPPSAHGANTPPMSKNQMKKLKRKLAWEEGAEERKHQRRVKQKLRKERRRNDHQALVAQAIAEGRDPAELNIQPQRPNPVKVPVSLVIDCDFEQYMTEKELISLSSQITRSYSENRKARFRSHLVMSSWKGKMRERYETVFADQFKYWKDVTFIESDFVEAAKQMKEIMAGPSGGTVIATLQTPENGSPAIHVENANEPLEPDVDETGYSPDVVYLSSDSPYVIERLEPGTSYVIGGIVDKNREKGLCYKIARERKVRTAKLPIGEYMVMQSRQVLTTNQVVEIMLKWLELGDWGQAFLAVIPKRKGGRLKGDVSLEGSSIVENENEGADEEEIQGMEGNDGEEGQKHQGVEEATSLNAEANAEADAGVSEAKPLSNEPSHCI
ncbi:tRNA (guanine(9)-N1)-methyltransferase [Ceratocystis fimbriata CBS 114723]|uniref:tRNA (guanine(9)-N1)-methyltransferase n=1 Tax=Ceratocystis fimbriata CBS 114723 TaxID=1035309 RepID=A0A2C5WVR5_9PEZI|nr:tRNA (guanine(9)-N1)-methyltransferase [Ceratocystis fimbriata CBS 114723]